MKAPSSSADHTSQGGEVLLDRHPEGRTPGLDQQDRLVVDRRDLGAEQAGAALRDDDSGESGSRGDHEAPSAEPVGMSQTMCSAVLVAEEEVQGLVRSSGEDTLLVSHRSPDFVSDKVIDS